MHGRRGTADRARRIDGAHARLYETVRTAHLERARVLEPAAIIYRRRRYDFDAAAAQGLELIQASPLRAGWLLFRSDVRVLEINEPLQLSSSAATALALAFLAASRITGRSRTTVVAYAIENADPRRFPAARLRSRLRRAAELFLSRRVWARVDRIVFGTDDARAAYESVLPCRRRSLTAEVVPALPAPVPGAAETTKAPGTVVFLGALVDRKGFPTVAAAWPEVRAARPDARLVIIGSGQREELARELVAGDRTVTFLRNPPREVIREVLLRSKVLTLPSQPRPDWREQVGLPIVEGLAAGCLIVTTTETGIAGWLADHGHRTIAVPTRASELAAAVVEALDDETSAADVVASLPSVDGRLDADRRLFHSATEFAPDQPPAVAHSAPGGA